jgi:hypothetical protein
MTMLVAFRHHRQVNLATLKPAWQSDTAIGCEVDLNARMALSVSRQKIYQQALN